MFLKAAAHDGGEFREGARLDEHLGRAAQLEGRVRGQRLVTFDDVGELFQGMGDRELAACLEGRADAEDYGEVINPVTGERRKITRS